MRGHQTVARQVGNSGVTAFSGCQQPLRRKLHSSGVAGRHPPVEAVERGSPSGWSLAESREDSQYLIPVSRIGRPAGSRCCCKAPQPPSTGEWQPWFEPNPADAGLPPVPDPFTHKAGCGRHTLRVLGCPCRNRTKINGIETVPFLGAWRWPDCGQSLQAVESRPGKTRSGQKPISNVGALVRSCCRRGCASGCLCLSGPSEE